MIEDFERCYRAVSARDPRFDGWFITAVTSTHIYCRPSCPALTPKRTNVRFFPTAAAAQAAGFRACKRCRPDASPGSPEWNVRGDLVARAMRLISDGIVEREGVGGLAQRLHFSERHLHRQIAMELGAGPQAIARAHRAQAARTLVETTDLDFGDIAFASGFGSIRQFNDTMRDVFATTPSDLRRNSGNREQGGHGRLALRLARREPFDGSALFAFLGLRAVAGIEEIQGDTYRRTLALPHGSGTAELTLKPDHVACTLSLEDVRDLGAAVDRCRALLDLDADPEAIDETLGKDRLLRSAIKAAPGRRVPGAVDGFELACRAVLGQQISVRGARTLASRLVAAFGGRVVKPLGALGYTWPEAEVLAGADLSGLGISPSRCSTMLRLAEAVAGGDISLDAGADRDDSARKLLTIKGIGPWTTSYIRMRALRDPDVFLATDLGARRAMHRLGVTSGLEEVAVRWRPWRSYALQYLWTLDGTKEER
jgi:AraC family transcriptional regulator, regulatory protein of adaptative response / DNA-3-methyladenine glycosylase II